MSDKSFWKHQWLDFDFNLFSVLWEQYMPTASLYRSFIMTTKCLLYWIIYSIQAKPISRYYSTRTHTACPKMVGQEVSRSSLVMTSWQFVCLKGEAFGGCVGTLSVVRSTEERCGRLWNSPTQEARAWVDGWSPGPPNAHAHATKLYFTERVETRWRFLITTVILPSPKIPSKAGGRETFLPWHQKKQHCLFFLVLVVTNLLFYFCFFCC